MVKYNFTLKIKGDNNQYSYFLDLTPNQENQPQQVFNSQLREDIRLKFQSESLCAIKEVHINQIINTWIQDIQEGYRDSTITLQLPLLIEAGIDEINEQGNQETPSVINPDLSDIEPIFGMLPPLNFF